MNIVIVYKAGKKFSSEDVIKLTKRLQGHNVYVLTDVPEDPDLQHLFLLPLDNQRAWGNWWAKMNLFSPEMEYLRPFLYMDLDMAMVGDVSLLEQAIPDKSKIVFTEDFYQQNGLLSSSLIWVPEDNDKVRQIWETWQRNSYPVQLSKRMDYFLRQCIDPDYLWQNIVNGVYSFKQSPSGHDWLTELPEDALIVDFHGNPTISEAAETVGWVNAYWYEENNYIHSYHEPV